MAYKVEITEPAEDELEEAISYISVFLGSPRAASELAEAYQGVIDLLETNPFIYAERPDYSAVAGVAIRCAHAKNYLVIYHIDEKASFVFIDAFMHESVDIVHRLGRRGMISR